MSRLAIAAILLAASGVAFAQPHTTTSQPTPNKPVPAKLEPKKSEPKTDAPAAALKVGSKAPAIHADKWVKGTEVKSFESGKVYVMEFWATWCPPCIKSIPLLTDLQKTHKDVTVIGMASSERKASTGDDKRLEKVESFVKGKGAEMDYTVAYDANRAMSKDWLQAAGQNGIPCAFVVDGSGKISWIGNPLNHEALVAAVDAAVKAAKSAPTTTPTDKPASTSPSSTPSAQPKPKG